ncbi:MAG: hypothetical protein Q4A00_07945 [Flavobacteriaceae bacterium]|nr:hypothetical protein [Flavobacteriaceae bacterium]
MLDKIIYIISFFLLLCAIFLLLDLAIPQIDLKKMRKINFSNGAKKVEEIISNATMKKKKMYEIVKNHQKKKKQNQFLLFIEDVRLALSFQKRANALGKLILASMIWFTIGSIFSILLNNIFLIPTMGGLFGFIPIIATILKHNKRKHELNIELESSLSIITSSYFRTNNIVLAVKENADYLNEPIRSIFLKFLVNANYIDSDIKKCIYKMKYELNHYIFHEWIDTMILCQEDKELKTTLLPVVAKLGDTRIIGQQLDTLIYNPLKEFIIVIIAYIASIFGVYFINANWWNILITTNVGKIYLSISFIAVIICLICVVNLTRPVEYKR